MPALALLAQIAQPLGRLRPADRVGCVANGIVDVVDRAVFVQLDHKLHILAHRSAVIATCRDDGILFEQPEGAGNDERAVEAVKENAGGKKRTVIFQHLHEGENIARQPVMLHPSVFQLNIVGDADDAANRHHIAVFQYRLGDAAQRVVLQNGVRVHADKVREICGVDAHVQRVRLAAVLFSDERHRYLLCACLIDVFLALTVDLPANGPVNKVHIKCLGQHLRGAVLRSVVHHDDLIGAVFQRKQRAHGVCHGDLLIVGGNDDTDGQVVIRGQNAFEHFLPAVLVQLK